MGQRQEIGVVVVVVVGEARQTLLNAPVGAFQNTHCTLTSIEPVVLVVLLSVFLLFLTSDSHPRGKRKMCAKAEPS